ncbi:C40 family peptidase [Streptomyces melanogenes]|uniref:C40 family peptidase n=1 Tax=Streptomyces melanogenes TaxID=67326 RepID=UPI0019887ACF|nr:C40 family peptidase [Streptomyces melanogenes]GGP89332.1 hypothetical protein GCM10010278_79720 [Streptomyces melanogenes]
MAAHGLAPSSESLRSWTDTILRISEAGARSAALERKVRQLRATASRARRQADWFRVQRDIMGDDLGSAAREQYRGGGYGALGQLLLAPSPQVLLDGWTVQRHMGHVLDVKFKIAKREAARRARVAATALRGQRAAEHERDVEASRQEQDRARLTALLGQFATGFGDGAWSPFSGVLAGADETPGRTEIEAVRFALSQLGSPYVWGATGPSSYDCSGLTSRAWSASGVTIPRTSQMQWAGLPRVGGRLRPGDLVIYFPDATHVGMYVGQGMVIHAPRPGTVVRLTALHRMPVLGVVRPGPAQA